VLVGSCLSDVDELLGGSPWAEIDRRGVAERAGFHEGVGGVAAGVAAALVAGAHLDAALILGVAPDRGYALLLRPVSCEGAASEP
jgi:3-oxoacyl-[acyl-carrier-protein] synthase II